MRGGDGVDTPSTLPDSVTCPDGSGVSVRVCCTFMHFVTYRASD